MPTAEPVTVTTPANTAAPATVSTPTSTATPVPAGLTLLGKLIYHF